MLDLSEPGNHPGINAIGLLQQTHPFRKLAYRSRVENRYPQLLRPQQCERQLLIAATGFHGYQFYLVLAAESSQLAYAFLAVGETTLSSFPSNAGLQRIRSNIHSTNDLGHGNLPCTCD